MLKKTFLITGFCLVSTSCLLIHISHANNLPELKFEQTCPDSNGYAPEFVYEDFNSSYLQELRTRFNLNDIVKDCTSEYDKILAVTNWVHHLWEHNGDKEPVKYDPISILQEVFEHKKQFRCVEYSIVLTGCLNALGLRSRILRLRTADVETREYGAGHVVTEAYLPSLSKWIMIDCQANSVPVLNELPLNAVEFQHALATKQPGLDIATQATNLTFKEYVNFIGQYLYYFQTALEPNSTYNNQQASIMLVPIGAPKPRIFQKTSSLNVSVYTNSVGCFYQKPN